MEKKLVLMTDMTSEDGIPERVNNNVYTMDEILLEYAYHKDHGYFFITEEEYEKYKKEGLCR